MRLIPTLALSALTVVSYPYCSARAQVQTSGAPVAPQTPTVSPATTQPAPTNARNTTPAISPSPASKPGQTPGSTTNSKPADSKPGATSATVAPQSPGTAPTPLLGSASGVKPATSANAHTDDQVLTIPGAVTPGETVTLRWFFTGDRVTLSGGRFGKGLTVTGRQSITDKPTANTHYVFDVTYRAQAPVGTTGTVETKTLHARYTADVDVFQMPKTKPYTASLGWTLSYQNGWQPVNVPTAAIKKDGLVFFQPEDDSVERLAVAVLPAKELTGEQLLQNVKKDMPSHYDEVRILTCDPITCNHHSAMLTRFTGMDLTHPGTRTESVILTFVQDGRAYVVSGRTKASQYRAHGPILERLVRSFTLDHQTLSARQ